MDSYAYCLGGGGSKNQIIHLRPPLMESPGSSVGQGNLFVPRRREWEAVSVSLPGVCYLRDKLGAGDSSREKPNGPSGGFAESAKIWFLYDGLRFGMSWSVLLCQESR